MHIVIDIPKDAYDYVMGSGYFPSNFNMISKIRNGIPLPEGHGRLKDVDHYIKMQWEHPDYSLTDDEPTIIEKDGD